ncbi:MAG: glycosyltransferase family 4 protein [Armatimonadetes bacterium]|nr:glycosyltransferase family 4 protein [Armatimonadota bacterium]
MKHTRPKILHITTVPGTLFFFQGQMRFIESQGFEVHALSSPGDRLERFGRLEGVPVHAVRMHRRITPLKDLAALWRIWRTIRLLRPEIVQAHTPKGGLLGMIAAWLARAPVRIYHIHGLPLTTARGYKRLILHATEKLSCLLAHQVFCVSHSLREIIVEKRLCPADKIKVLMSGSANGIDATGRFNPDLLPPGSRREVRERYGIPDSALVIGFVGRLVRDKGIAELAAAWKILRERHPSLHLLLAGEFEGGDPVPRNAKDVLSRDRRVHLVGRVEREQMPGFYTAMDTLVLPTYREGFPTVLAEAAAMRLPVVATQAPGCRDAVWDGATGTLVPVRDAEALANAIERYLGDPAMRRRHGHTARMRMLKEFRCEDMWAAVHSEYLRLLHERGIELPFARETDSQYLTETRKYGNSERL